MALTKTNDVKLTIDGSELDYLISVTPNLDGQEIDVSVLKNVWDKMIPGTKSLTFDCEMLHETGDAVGESIRDAYFATDLASQKLTNAKLYLWDSTTYIYADVVADTDANVNVPKYNVLPIARNDVVKASFTLRFSGTPNITTD